MSSDPQAPVGEWAYPYTVHLTNDDKIADVIEEKL